jgi:hypothetical protein
MLFELEDYLVKAADLLRWADQADVKVYTFARGPERVYGPRAVGRDFRSIGERATPSRQISPLGRWRWHTQRRQHHREQPPRRQPTSHVCRRGAAEKSFPSV